MAPALGFEQAGPPDQASGAGQGAIQAPPASGAVQAPPSSGAVQAPPSMKGTPQITPRPPQGQRPPLTAEQFLQRGGWTWWKDESIKKELNLTPRQVQRITGIFEGRVRDLGPFYDELQRQLAELERLTKERTADVVTYTVQVNRAEALRSKLNETRSVMLYRFLRELDPAQHQKLREIADRRRNSRGGGPPAPRSW